MKTNTKTKFANCVLLSFTALAVMSLNACSQKKISCSGNKCAQPASIDAVTDAGARTKVGIMNFDQLQTQYSALMGFKRAPTGTLTAQNVTDTVNNGFYNEYGNANSAGLRDALPVSNRISEFSSSHQMSIQKNAYNACDTGIKLDIMLYPSNGDTSARKIIPGLPLAGLQELATPEARTAVINHMIEELWMTNVAWVPTNDEALEVLLPLFEDISTTLPRNNSDAEQVVLKTICSVILASAPAMTL